MLAIAAGIIFFLVLFTGVGLVFPYKLLRAGRMVADLLGAFWVGLALAVGFLQVWHLFAPVGTLSLAILATISLAGWLLNRRAVWGWLRGMSAVRVVILSVLTALPLLVFSNQAMWGEVHFDHGLYHLQMVKWIENFAIVPGLGNLHHRFAFNNSSFLFVAQINPWIFRGLAYYTASTLLCFAVVLRGLNALYHLVRKERPLAFSEVYQALLLPCALFYVVNSYFTGYSPDIFIFALQAVLAGELIEAFSKTETSSAELPRLLTRIVLLSALAVTVKLSAAVFSAGMMLAALGVFLWRRKALDVKFLRLFGGWVGMGAALIGPWLVRSVILSGYLVYPSPLISFNVPWKIPLDMVAPIAPIIRQWAMYRSNTTPDVTYFEWLRTWSGQIPFAVKAGSLGLVLLLLVVLGLRLRDRKQALEWKGPAAVFAISGAGLLYWFLAAPDFRFSGAVFWLLGISTLLVFYQQVLGLFPKFSPKLLVGLFMLVLLVGLRPDFSRKIEPRYLVTPNLEYKIAARRVAKGTPPTQTTRSGLAVYMANDESQQACWDEPLPCTRVKDFDPRLVLIDPLDMQKGFAVRP